MRFSLKPLFALFAFVVFLALATPLHAARYTISDDVVGALSTYTVKKGDTLGDIARRFDLGLVELLAANPSVTDKTLKEGITLTIPTLHVLPAEPARGIVINLPELRLYYYPQNGTVLTFPISIGSEGWETPTGRTTITRKRLHPSWVPPDSIRAENPDLPDFVPPGPDNPLGDHALNLGWASFAIHGTNSPYSIGKRSSHGCIRLYPEDIAVLFDAVEVGTPVTVVDTPYKLGWRENTLFLEVTPTQTQADDLMHNLAPLPAPPPDIRSAIREAGATLSTINWPLVERTIAEHTGVPVAIGH